MKARIVFLIAVIACTGCARRMASVHQREVSRPLTVPLLFERNDGQAPAQQQFVVRRGDLRIGFGASHATLSFGDTAVSLRFRGARPVVPQAGVPADARVSYFIGSNPRQWHTDIPTFESIRYAALYPGIDAIFYPAGDAIEYDLIVAPHGDAHAIALELDGATSRLHTSGDLIVRAGTHTIIKRKPVAYQTIGDVRREVDVRYAFDGDAITFDVANYDSNAPLVIDPVIAYSTQFGGSGDDHIRAAAMDPAGNLYVAGDTKSTNFPTTTSSYHHTGGTVTSFVAKVRADGQKLLYAAIIGGGGADAIAVDATGAAYVAGVATSSDFPTTAGAFKSSCAFGSLVFNFGCGYFEGFLLKLTPTGSALAFSTFFGGRSQEDVRGVAVDAAGEATVVGDTFSDDFPVTPGAFSQRLRNNGMTSDAFITKVSADGSQLVFSTYFGGNGDESATAIRLDASGSEWITGATSSADLPVLGGFQVSPASPANPNAGIQDSFVARFTPDGALTYSTYFGGDGDDYADALAVGAEGVFFAGRTGSTSLIGGGTRPSTTSTAAFVTQLVVAPSRTTIATRYLDGSGTDVATGVALSGGLVHIGGVTWSTAFPLTADAWQGSVAGTIQFTPAHSFYATVPLTTNGILASPSFSTFFGGPKADGASGLVADGAGGVYLFGDSQTRDMPLVNAHWRGSGSNEGFIVHAVPNAVFTSADARDIVLYAADAALHGNYNRSADPTAAAARRIWDPVSGVASLDAPSAAPVDYFDIAFQAPAGVEFRLWMRGSAAMNSTTYDSVWAQFSDSVDAAGQPIWRIGSSAGMAMSLEECDGCGVSGWGWHDDGSGVGVRGPSVRFAATGGHTLRIQTRETGLGIDQLILSSHKWLTARPGAPKKSTNVYPKTRF
jgi:beta-propeller repeat-containing protein